MRWLTWAVYLAALSLVLLTPQPPQLVRAAVGPETGFTLAKSFHLAAFALLAILSGRLPLSGRGRWVMLAALSLYAAGTEALQTLVPGRSGCWPDVTLNHTGLFLGLAASFPWWRS